MAPQEKNQLELSVAEEVPLHQVFERQEKRHFLEHLIVFAKHKFFIMYVVGSVTVAAIVISFLLPKYYTSEVTIMPPQQGQSIATAMLDQLGAVGGLIGATAGKELGLKNPGDLYVAMLKSHQVADDLIDRFSLKDVYQKKLLVDTEKQLDNMTEITANIKDGTISVFVEDRDPKRAAAMANAYVEELEKLTQKLAVTDASKRRTFFEHEAGTANQELANAEQQLKETEERTGIFQLDSQSRVALQGYEDLRAQVTAKEVEIQTLSSFETPDNPDLVRAQRELAALRVQVSHYEVGQGGRPIGDPALEKVPARALEYVRKLREVKYRESLLQLMLKQYEIARIDEAKDSSMIQVLDKAVPPERRSWPRRTLIVISFAFLAFLVALLCSYWKEAIEKAREDPQYLTRMQLLKFYLTRGRKSGVSHR